MKSGKAGTLSRRTLVTALVVGGFGIGVSEFLVMGLLPQMAADFLPELYAASPDRAIAASGGVAWSYAIGVVVGMFLTPILLRRLSERATLLWCAGLMAVATLLLAFAPSLPVAFVLRFIAAQTHATYIGVGAMMVAHLQGTNNYGRGSAFVHGGMAVANLAGVPALTALGANVDWRLIMGGAALLFALPFVALLTLRPVAHAEYAAEQATSGGRGGVSRRFIFIMLAAIFFSSSGFVVLTYVAPVAEWAQGGAGWLTAASGMLAFGIGMNIGNLSAGVLADRAAGATFAVTAIAGVAGSVILLIPGTGGVGAAAAFLLIGVAMGGAGPSSQVLYVRELPRFPRLASSVPSGAGNMGSFVGALAGAGLLAGMGPGALPIGALVLGGLGLVLLLGARVLKQRHA